MSVDNGYRNFGEGFERYIKPIENLPRISSEEEKELSVIIQTDPDAKRVSDAIDKLVVSNLLLVVKFAINYFHFINKGEFEISIMDLISEGNVGLFKAATTYEGGKAKFSTHASHHIKKHLHNSRYSSRFIRLPINYFTIINIVKKRLGDRDTLPENELQEIAKSQGASLCHVKFVIECYKKDILSIDQPQNNTSYDGDDTNSYIDSYPSPDKPLDELISAKENRDYLLSKIETLSEREQEVIFVKYFGDSHTTCQDLGELWGISKQRISQILIEALKKLKIKIVEDNASGKES